MMRGALLSFLLARSKPYCLVLLLVRLLCCAQEVPPTLLIAKSFYPLSTLRAVHVISRTRLSPILVYYGFKGRSLYARRGEPGDEARTSEQGTLWGHPFCPS